MYIQKYTFFLLNKNYIVLKINIYKLIINRFQQTENIINVIYQKDLNLYEVHLFMKRIKKNKVDIIFYK